MFWREEYASFDGMPEASFFAIIFTSIPLSRFRRCCRKYSRTYRLSWLRTTALPTLLLIVIPSRVCPSIPRSKSATKCLLETFRFFRDNLRNSVLFKMRLALLKSFLPFKPVFSHTFFWPSGKTLSFVWVITNSVSGGKSLSSFWSTSAYNSSSRLCGHSF